MSRSDFLTAQVSEAEVTQVNQTCAGEFWWNPDLAPVPPSKRKWVFGDVAALWMSLAACVPTYILASSFIDGGMNWWQAILTIFIGNVIVLGPMLLNAHAGTKYGIPFPVLCRASFGMRGANIPALLRALVACGWFGIQCWIGGWALYKIFSLYFPAWDALPVLPWLGINAAQLICFALFWLANQIIIYRGIESVRVLFKVQVPLLIVLAVVLLVWAYIKADGFGPMLSQPSQFEPGGKRAGEFWSFFFPALTANVGFWATLALNIPDFTRYVRTQRAQLFGQAVGLPFSMGVYSFIGVAVTSATIIIFGAPVWDPVELLAKFNNPLTQLVGLIALIIATLATNLAANAVGPANDFANILPRNISFRAGALITGFIGVAIQPWRLVSDPTGYIFTWLIAYSALLGAIGGVMICDYYLHRRTQLDLAGLYQTQSPYWYTRGFNILGVVALLAGVAPCLPGFLATVGALQVASFWTEIYNYAWFISFAIAFAVYAGGLLLGKARA